MLAARRRQGRGAAREASAPRRLERSPAQVADLVRDGAFAARGPRRRARARPSRCRRRRARRTSSTSTRVRARARDALRAPPVRHRHRDAGLLPHRRCTVSRRWPAAPRCRSGSRRRNAPSTDVLALPMYPQLTEEHVIARGRRGRVVLSRRRCGLRRGSGTGNIPPPMKAESRTPTTAPPKREAPRPRRRAARPRLHRPRRRHRGHRALRGPPGDAAAHRRGHRQAHQHATSARSICWSRASSASRSGHHRPRAQRRRQGGDDAWVRASPAWSSRSSKRSW